ncbi:hypothetical protein C1I98_28350 [Spongiactinospora gelatinilytica]|uniref:Transposase n=1 Tax=Spongiactinospora gelatinilytica TaxID=2666298 RepID=A0A2W2FEY0_9ACTN|nr:hypothetical protein [Spongiactinospora gelatinilytica]PZG34222.1 hypothetical protein C1I98_28350 [Spongiactinospora gelatinilytica]
MTTLAASHPAINHACTDRTYQTTVIDGGATLGIDLEAVRRDAAIRSFTPLPRRWVAELTFDRLMLRCHLIRDHEALPTRSVAMIYIAMIDLTTRRLTGESAFTWHGALTREQTGLNAH